MACQGTSTGTMPSQPPYLYTSDEQSSQHGFDPKAITRASWTPAASSVGKPDGALLDFNKHPDSYLILPYGKTDAKPMAASVKKSIKTVRWVQFAFRSAQMVGALGLLFCVICIKNTDGGDGYIIRVPVRVEPRIGIVTTLMSTRLL